MITETSVAQLTGYLSPDYAYSLAEFGEPRLLINSGGWVLQRRIPGFYHSDAMGCYPLFTCQDWSRLGDDLRMLEGELVSLSLVTDPFGDFDETLLSIWFSDVCKPFKNHYVRDLFLPAEDSIARHHLRNIERGEKAVTVERCDPPDRFLEDWIALYQHLIQRHNIQGIARFSRAAFARQLSIPGLVMFRAHRHGKTVGMLLWFLKGNVAYYHLGAFSPEGYRLNASYALFWNSIRFFKTLGLHWLDLGAAPGIRSDASNGLDRFKRGWATGTRTAYFCGKILNHTKYEEIARVHGNGSEDYFPSYRKGEFK